MKRLLLALILAAATSMSAGAVDTIGIYGDTGAGLSRYIDTTLATPFDIVVLQQSARAAGAVEFTITEIEALFPGVFKLATVKPNNTPLDLGDNSNGEYLMALLGCVDPPIELVRVTYIDFADIIPDDFVLEVTGILPTGQYPSSFDGEPGYAICPDDVLQVLTPEPPGYVTGAGVVVPPGGAVLNPTYPVLPDVPAVQFALEVSPETINLKSPGVRVSVTLSSEGQVGMADVDPNTLLLNGAAPIPRSIKLTGGPGGAVLRAQFNGEEVVAGLTPAADATLTLTGSLLDGSSFTASDDVRLIGPGNGPGASGSKFDASASPNPFNPSTTISFTLPSAGFTELVVYDVSGRRVKTLMREQARAGEHHATWNGLDESGRAVASGVYLYQVRSGGVVENHRIVLLK